MNDYQSILTVNATAGDVMEKIGQVAKWWAQDIEGSSQRMQDIFTVYFGDTYVSFKVTEQVPDKKVVWLVTDCHLPWLKDQQEWTGTKIVFELSASGAQTRLSITHIGLVPEIECFNDCKKGWDFYLKESLFQFIREGKGQPQPPKARSKAVVS